MIFDGHVHLFHPKVISNVKKRTEMVEILNLQTRGADHRVGVQPLEDELKKNCISGALVLPTAGVTEVARINDASFQTIGASSLLHTAGTLHPGYEGIADELVKFEARGIKAIKLCSFSQRFSLDDSKTVEMFDHISEFNETRDAGFFVILDTLYRADRFFGSDPDHNTTPKLLADLVKGFPLINFVAAHMGGLAAPFKEIQAYLTPRENFFLDTSNGAHVLTEDEFVRLLTAHGPDHIIFGTDWPWFTPAPEIELQTQRFDRAGYSLEDRERVFSKNIRRLLGIAG